MGGTLKMKKVIAVALVLVLVFCTMGATTTSQADSNREETAEPERNEPFMNIIELPDIKDYYTTETWILSFCKDEVEPLNADTICSYEQSVCIGNMHFVYRNGKSATWDLYVYDNDGVEGVQIINQAGQAISFYGDILTSAILNYNIELSREIYVYPEGENLESYTVVVSKG